MKRWNELSMAERVPYIRMALDSGITDLGLVSDRYNKFAKGGLTKEESSAMWKKVQPYYNQFIKAGIQPDIALAIVGNIAQESGGNPNANNGKYLGLVQNEPAIRKQIQRAYGDYSANSQIQFIIDGLQGKLGDKGISRELVQRFTNFSNKANNLSAGELALLWENTYELSGGQGNSRRRAFTESFSSMPNRVIEYDEDLPIYSLEGTKETSLLRHTTPDDKTYIPYAVVTPNNEATRLERERNQVRYELDNATPWEAAQEVSKRNPNWRQTYGMTPDFETALSVTPFYPLYSLYQSLFTPLKSNIQFGQGGLLETNDSVDVVGDVIGISNLATKKFGGKIRKENGCSRNSRST